MVTDPGINSNLAPAFAYDYYSGRYAMAWQERSSHQIKLMTSTDGASWGNLVTWSSNKTSAPMGLACSQLTGGECALVYVDADNAVAPLRYVKFGISTSGVITSTSSGLVNASGAAGYSAHAVSIVNAGADYYLAWRDVGTATVTTTAYGSNLGSLNSIRYGTAGTHGQPTLFRNRTAYHNHVLTPYEAAYDR
ncbi:MAG: hypothetical protein H0U59_13820 [Gemmatimonadaceae bacterium]|nr:hypothetical protein [Gemmatimonadaceae bacterium]